MRTSRLDRLAALVIVVTLGTLIGSSARTDAAFVVPTDNPANSFSAHPDWKPPTVARAAVVKAEGGIPGYVRAGGGYTVVASAADDPSSNPPSGVGTGQANASSLTTGATAVALPVAASTIGGLTYTNRSAVTTVTAGRAEGNYAGALTVSDQATPANTSATLGFSAVVDNTAPIRTSATVTNGGTARRMDAGDRIVYLWSEIIDPEAVLAGWDGSSTPVSVRVLNAGGSTGDTLTVRNAANTAQLPLGSLETNVRDFITAQTTFGGPANATRSTMIWNSTTGAITVTLGPPDTAGTINTGGTNAGRYEWLPQAVYDRAGNLSNTTLYAEANDNDRDF